MYSSILVLGLLICLGCLGVDGRKILYTTHQSPDLLLQPCDDCYTAVNLRGTYRLYGQPMQNVFVSSNGYITCRVGLEFYYPERMSAATAWEHPARSCPIIAPLFSDNTPSDVTRDSRVWSIETTNPDLLNEASRDINSYFQDCGGGDFTASGLFLVTWQGMASFCDVNYVHPADKQAPRQRRFQRLADANSKNEDKAAGYYTNTYQLALVTDGEMTFAIFNMDDIGWDFCFDYNTSGFSAGDGIRSHDLPHSGTPEVAQLMSESNVDSAGRWMFRVDGDIILNSECLPAT